MKCDGTCDTLRAQLAASEAARVRLREMRAAGWSVAVHNDYRQGGESFTFWLFTHPSGRWAKGEGRTDDDAVAQAHGAALAADAGNEQGARR